MAWLVLRGDGHSRRAGVLKRIWESVAGKTPQVKGALITMRNVKTLMVALLAVFALSAVAVSAASAALPELGRCVAKAGGKYKDSNCTEKVSSGSFERETGPGTKPGFTSKSGKGTLETTAGTKVTCESDEDTGEYSGAKKVVKVIVTFKGCKFNGEEPCENATLEEGTIRTAELKGELGYIEPVSKKVGLSLTPTTAKGAFVEFECFRKTFPIKIAVKEGAGKGGNSVIGEMTPVNQMTLTFLLNFKQALGIQNPTMFSGGSLDVLESNGERAGEETEDTITNKESLEIFA